jgi:hypothetical protein
VPLPRHKLENERQSDGLLPRAIAWSLASSSLECAGFAPESSTRSEFVMLPSSAAALDEKDPNGKQELDRRDVSGADAGPALATGGETIDGEPEETDKLGRCSGVGERAGAAEEAGALDRDGEVKRSCCGLGAVTRVKKPVTAWRAFEKEREIFSKTREGS